MEEKEMANKDMANDNIYKKLQRIQAELKVPKEQHNKFGDYDYRSTEDILEKVKPLLEKNELALTLSDDIVLIGERYYVKATVTLTDVNSEKTISVTTYAREQLSKKGQDEGQITGATSSYARKYALNGLFAIDGTADLDALPSEEKENQTQEEQKPKRSLDVVLRDMFDKGQFSNIQKEEVGGLIKQKEWFDKDLKVKQMTEKQFKRLLALLNNEDKERKGEKDEGKRSGASERQVVFNYQGGTNE